MPGPGVPDEAAPYDYAPLIGRRIILGPSGEDSSLDSCLPRRATITREVAIRDWGGDWLVVELDEPFDYKRIRVEYCLIRARWPGHPVGSEFCPVFLVVDPDRALFKQSSWSSADFASFSWAEVQLEQSANQ